MTKDDQVSATKSDLQNLRQEISRRFEQMDQQFQTLIEYMKTEAEETRRHFDVVAEDMRHDFKGVFHDKIE